MTNTIELVTCPACWEKSGQTGTIFPSCVLCHGRGKVPHADALDFYLKRADTIGMTFCAISVRSTPESRKRRNWAVWRRFVFVLMFYVIGLAVGKLALDMFWVPFLVGCGVGFLSMNAALKWDKV